MATCQLVTKTAIKEVTEKKNIQTAFWNADKLINKLSGDSIVQQLANAES